VIWCNTVYCVKCGAEIELGNDFCGKCGHKVGSAPQRPNTVVMREKSEGGAAVLSLLWGGLGQIYVGKIARGLGIMLVCVLLSMLSILLLFVSFILIIFMALIMLAFLIWNIFDAYNLAKEYNNHLMTTGNRPW